MRSLTLTILTFAWLQFTNSAAQTIQVAEKVIEKTIDIKDLKNIKDIEIHSEKAEMIITRGDVDKIHVKLTFTAGHINKDVATDELRFHKYAFGPRGSTFFFQQTYYLGDAKRVMSKLSAKIELVIPPNMNVIANGEYTDFKLSDGTSSNDFRMKFGNLLLENVDGSTKVDTDYGNIEINYCTATINIVAKRSDIVLRLIHPIAEGSMKTSGKEQIFDAGNFKIRNTSGTIQIEK